MMTGKESTIVDNGSELRARYNDVNRGVYFIGTTPPKSDTPLDMVDSIATKLLERVSDIDFDGLIVSIICFLFGW